MKRQQRLEILKAVLTWLLVVATVAIIALLAFHAGKKDNGLADYTNVSCNDIIREIDGRLVCEVNMQQEDDNILIYRGKGTIQQ